MRIQEKVWTARAAILIGMGLATSSALAQLPREISKPLDEAKALVDRANQKLDDIANRAESEKGTLDKLIAMANDPKNFPVIIRLASESKYRMAVAAKESQGIVKYDLAAAAVALKEAQDAADANGLTNEVLLTVKVLNRRINMAVFRAQDVSNEANGLVKAFTDLIDKVTIKTLSTKSPSIGS